MELSYLSTIARVFDINANFLGTLQVTKYTQISIVLVMKISLIDRVSRKEIKERAVSITWRAVPPEGIGTRAGSHDLYLVTFISLGSDDFKLHSFSTAVPPSVSLWFKKIC